MGPTPYVLESSSEGGSNQATGSLTAINDLMAQFSQGAFGGMTTIEATGTQAATDRLFDRFFADRYEPMVRMASTMVDERDTAEELVQDAFQRVWVRWDDLTEPSCYLRTIVVNNCNDELRRRRVRRVKDRPTDQMPTPEPHYLADVLSTVAPKRRKALVLRYYGGHSMSEVAEAMNIPTGTAKSLIHRGLADMRGAIN